MTPFTTKELADAGVASLNYQLEHRFDRLRKILKRLKTGNQVIIKKDMVLVIHLLEQNILMGGQKP